MLFVKYFLFSLFCVVSLTALVQSHLDPKTGLLLEVDEMSPHFKDYSTSFKAGELNIELAIWENLGVKEWEKPLWEFAIHVRIYLRATSKNTGFFYPKKVRFWIDGEIESFPLSGDSPLGGSMIGTRKEKNKKLITLLRKIPKAKRVFLRLEGDKFATSPDLTKEQKDIVAKFLQAYDENFAPEVYGLATCKEEDPERPKNFICLVSKEY